MARYTHDSVERVRDAIDMVDLVGARTELKRSGVNRLQGLCPFHDERTPSFGIDPVQKLYHCFGCGVGGDAIDFVKETEGVDFKGAIELLADRYGIQLEVEDEDPKDAERRIARERLYALLDRTAAYYVRVLWEGREAQNARTYLSERGLDEATLRQFRVGYAPSGWSNVMDASLRAGYKNQELYDAGLVTRAKGEGRLYDRFRGRLMFPLADARGRVVGFGARAMGESLGAKYINTPESPLFQKRKQVYGADLARASAAKAGAVIVTEGYTDVIALAQAGFPNSVCIMGTSLTEEQVRVLRRLAPVAQLALDADNAGQEAMLRAARVARGESLDLRVVQMPEGLDPADLVRVKGRDEVERLLARSQPFVQFNVRRTVAKGDLSTPEGKQRVLDEVAPIMADVGPGIVRDELMRFLSDRLDVPYERVDELLRRAPKQRPAEPAPPRRRPAPAAATPSPGDEPEYAGAGPGDEDWRNAPARPAPAAAPTELSALLERAAEPERRFLAFCIALPDIGRQALGQIDLDEHLTSPLVRRAAEHLRTHLHAPASGLPEHDPDLTALVRALAVRATQEPASPAALRAQRLHLELRRLERLESNLRAAGQGGLTEVAARKELVRAEMGEAVEEASAN
jgi:DNA primase